MQGYANSVTIILTKFWQETEIQCQRKKQNPTKILATSQTLSYQILVKQNKVRKKCLNFMEDSAGYSSKWILMMQ